MSGKIPRFPSTPPGSGLLGGRDQGRWRQILCVVSFALLFLTACGLEALSAAFAANSTVEAIPLELDLTGSRDHFGSLTFLAGFELKSADPRFGGLSGLAVAADGSMLYAVSDRGYWVSASMRHDREGRLIGFGVWEIARLLTPEGVPVSGRQTDAEGLAQDRDGSFIVSFEQEHRLWRYPPSSPPFRIPPQAVSTPHELAQAPNNGGIEAVTVLLDGRLLAITEEYENPDGSLKAWLIDKEQFAELSYLPSDGYRPTDMTTLANGDLLVLERRHSLLGGWGARIHRLSRDSLRPGARLKGEEIARIVPPLPVDNFEGIAIWEKEEGGTFLYLVSDDNYSPLQRTLFLQFRLESSGPGSDK